MFFVPFDLQSADHVIYSNTIIAISYNDVVIVMMS